MPSAEPNLFTRDDTFLGVCEGVGEDLGVDPLWLRLALTLALFVSPTAAIGGYLAAGVIVLASRLLFPTPKPAAAAEPLALTARRAANADEADQYPLPLAA